MQDRTFASSDIEHPPSGLAERVWVNAEEDPSRVQFVRPAPVSRGWPARRSVRGGDLPVTCAQFRDDVSILARGLVAAGVGQGDRVALMSRTRYEWTLVDYALWAVGAVTVPIYETSTVDLVRWILQDSGAVACVVETGDHAALVAAARPGTPALRETWQIDAGGLITLAGLGRDITDTEIEARRRRVLAGDMATIVYTSGTTGRPKGCVLTHGAISRDALSAVSVLPQLLHGDASTVLFLPLAHAFARLIQVGVVQTRTTMVHSSDVAGMPGQLRRHRPTFVLAVPRVFERMYDQARQQARDAHRGWLFTTAERIAVRYSRALDRRGGPSIRLRLAHSIYDVLVYRRLQDSLGGRCRAAIVGGAPMSEHLGHFFRGAGITVLEGYGLTETSPALTVNRLDRQRIGTVGAPLPNVRIRVAADGEIQAHGGVVFAGYWNNPDATRDAFTDDGWLRTGDLGRMDAAGFLHITDRKKELINTASGEQFAPAPIEDAISAHSMVSQCVLVGDGRPYVAALVTIDPGAWQRWRDTNEIPAGTLAELRDHPRLRAEIQTVVDRVNHCLSRADQVKTFRILPRTLTVADNELTPTLKVKRATIAERYASDIDDLYRGHCGPRPAGTAAPAIIAATQDSHSAH